MLYLDAKTWSCRPSELLRLSDAYTSYCLDSAVAYFGRSVEAELDGVEAKTAAEGKQKRMRVLNRFLSDDDKPQPGTFADPAKM